MPAPKTGSEERGFHGLSVNLSREYAKRQQAFYDLGLREVAQQYQLDLIDTAAGWTYADITFDFPFSYAPSQRESDVIYPHFTFGVYCPLEDEDAGDAPFTPSDQTPCLVQAVVTHYERDPDTDQFIGARVFFHVERLGSSNKVEASIHITFQGYAAPEEDETELT